MKEQAMFEGDLTSRRYDLDWVRIGAFMLLILYHVGMYYVTWDWQVKSVHASATIEPLMMLSSPWRLSLLFLVSGVATGYLLQRQASGRFIGSRSYRLLIPLAFGVAFIVPPQSYFEVVEKVAYAGSYADFWQLYITGYHGFCKGSNCLVLPTWNHLWFVAYLWVYTLLLYVAVRSIPRLAPRLRSLAERWLGGWNILLLPILYLVVIRVFLADGFPATHALVDDWYNHALYGPIFLLGFALAGTAAPWSAIERVRRYSLALAVLGWASMITYLHIYSGDTGPMPSDGLRALMHGVYGAEQWLAIAAVLGFARRHLVHDSSARRYLTTAIFPVYILHQTIIIVAAHLLKPADLNPVLEGFLLIAITGAACLLGYEAIRRVRWLRPLFGLASMDRNSAAKRHIAPGSVMPMVSDDVH